MDYVLKATVFSVIFKVWVQFHKDFDRALDHITTQRGV